MRPSTVLVSRDAQLPSRGLTLIEMLIGMAITLVMMAAVVNLFANIGSGVRIQRASMEIGSQLRATRARLYMDLAGATCAPRPKLPSDDHNDGYLEIVEGVYSDKNPSILLDGIDNGPTSTNPELNYAVSQVPSGGDPGIVPPAFATTGAITNGGALGDYDDILALTVRSDNEPFRGRWVNTSTGNTEVIESNLAEVVWFAVENPADGSLGEPGMRTVYRRVLLIAPWVQGDLQLPSGGNVAEDLLNFYRENDISVRREITASGDIWVPNSLGDLVKRENRFGHFLDAGGGLGYPFFLNQAAIRAATYNPSNASVPPSFAFGPLRPFGPPFDGTASEERQGDDLLLNDVLAFDVRVFDPGAPLVLQPPNIVLEPADNGWYPPTATEISGFGSFTDMGWSQGYSPLPAAPDPLFNIPHLAGWHPRTPAASIGFPAVYDTWSYHYESDGLDQDNGQDNGAGIDQGTNGLDDNVGFGANNGTDDSLEREAPPPYDVPLRGIQVKLRVYEPDTRQIREATVTRGLVPQ